jgi:RNA polymerase sigma factor (sigma-70 family)
MTASALAAFREQSTRVDDALQLLEVEIRAVVELRYREGLKVRDIGKHLGIAPSTAMKRLQNGLRELKGLLGPLD